MNERFNLVLESTGEHLIPAVTRLRGLLKLMLRGYGLKVIEARELSPDASGSTLTAGDGKRDVSTG